MFLYVRIYGGFKLSNWFPRVYDTFMSPLEKNTTFQRQRQRLIAKASGKVLEIGAGTGVNFSYYTEKIESVVATDPNPEMVHKAQKKVNESRVPLKVITASAEQLTFPDHTFDTVIGTLVFCTIPNPERALKELSRVLKPGGTFLSFEHVQMKQPHLKVSQTVLTPLWKHLCDGCHLNHDTLGLFETSPFFQINQVNSLYKGLFLSFEGVNHHSN